MSEVLCEYVARRMPMRAAVVGPERMRAIVNSVVAHWPHEALSSCKRGQSLEKKILSLTEDRVLRDERHGFVWTVILGAVLSSIIRMVMEWWLARPSHRLLMKSWKDGGR